MQELLRTVTSEKEAAIERKTESKNRTGSEK